MAGAPTSPESGPPEPPAHRIAIPASVTLAGVFFGLLSMTLASTHPYAACLAIMGASLCDMIDGRVARAVGARSKFGGELDSLADVVSFGVAPAWLAYTWSLEGADSPLVDPWLLVPFAFLACGAIRLARFNVDPSAGGGSDDEFGGLPIPAGALLITTAIMASHELGLDAIRGREVMTTVVIVAGLLMVSPLPLPNYKRFPTRRLQITWYGLIAGGLTTLAFGGPGGAILLGFIGFYVLIGVRRLVARRGQESAPA